MRKFAARIHVWLAIPLGGIFFLICFSGAALVFRREIRQWTHPHLYFIRSEERPKLTPSELMECVRKVLPDSLKVSSIQMYNDPSRTCMVGFSNVYRKTLSVNPYTGRINGWEDKESDFLSYVKKLHVSLLDKPIKGEWSWGKTIVGITTLGALFIFISGLILWWPRSRVTLRKRFKIALSVSWRRFWYDSHVVGGFYALVFLLLMALTGLTWSFSWYRSVYYALLGGTATADVIRPVAEKKEPKEQTTLFYAWDAVLEQLQQRYPDYKHIEIELQQAQVATDARTGMRNFDTALFDPQTGKIRGVIQYDEKPCAQKIEALTFALHTGIWGGVASKVLTCIVTLLGAMLPLTGYYLWLKKK